MQKKMNDKGDKIVKENNSQILTLILPQQKSKLIPAAECLFGSYQNYPEADPWYLS